MGITVFFDEQSRYAAEVVSAALRRSFTAAQTRRASFADALDALGDMPRAAVLINPPAGSAPLLARLLTAGRKALVLGRVEPAVADLLGLELVDGQPVDPALALAKVNHGQHRNESSAGIRYSEHALAQASPLRGRALSRFDFQNEWNNLGYGAVTADGSAWSLAVFARPNGCEPIAWLTGPGDALRAGGGDGLRAGDGDALRAAEGDGLRAGGDRLYAALRDDRSGAALWFNRPVGPVDSGEWRVVETFFADYRAADLVCLPALSEIPAGYSAAATMRLDCDESIHAARPLWEMYRDCGFPLSLAVLTGQPTAADDIRLLEEVAGGGGSVLAHSVSHAPNWGGCYEAASREARESKSWLERNSPRCAPVEFAVSPFHQNPIYAVQALADAGYAGFVGGIIANDPEFLLGRAGQVPFVERPLVSHSAQCMLHGDCYQRCGNSIDVYAQSFDNHVLARSIFGFLDHPFSPRYQYGWSDEPARIEAHRLLIRHIAGAGDVWRPNLADALRFLARRNAVQLSVEGGSRLRWRADSNGQPANGLPRLEARWKGAAYVE